ncbi:MAG: M13 family metallopeptidase [Candidatus Sericytochromatia bacterium]|nr:M13 family metallopeptidase [Candidatus Sericytochromatia bacterium]
MARPVAPCARSLRPFGARLVLAASLMGLVASPAAAGLAGWTGGDPAVRPQDDMFLAANGGWLKATAIPADKRAYGTFLLLRERSDEEVRALLEQAARSPGSDADARLIGAFYGSFKDTAAIDRRGLVPLGHELARIGHLRTRRGVARLLAELGTIGIGTPIGVWVQADAKDPTVNTVYWTHGGLGLPDREDYLSRDDKAVARRAAYRTYLETLFGLAARDARCPMAEDGDDRSPVALAEDVLAFETRLAALHWKRAERRDPLRTYNPVPLSELAATYGEDFDWATYAEAVGIPKGSTVVMREVSFFKGFGPLAANTPVETWRAYLQARLLDGAASMLPAAYRKAAFEFRGRALAGLQVPEKRWKTAVQQTNGYVGEAIGRRFVALHFPPAAKARMQALVTNLLDVYRDGLTHLAWMTPETRRQALAKLAGMRVKIGYPDAWRGYRGLVFDRQDALGNALRASRFLHARELAEVGKPVDRSRWMMEPQVVNAYYSPLGNEIVFPAAILRPPFFDMQADDAFNYGAIGAVIGHEISHGFDDSGRRYDAAGRLRDWWTPADEAAFKARADRLVAQYGSYEPLPGLKVDGNLTLGENIADLAGVAMAYRAYERSLGGKAAPVKDGLTGPQRFFLGYARVWRSKSRPEWLRTRLQTDSHSPEQYRVNGVLTNLDAFHQAFGLKPGDGMFKAASERVRIW